MTQHPRDQHLFNLPLLFSAFGSICTVIMATWQVPHQAKPYVKNKKRDQKSHLWA